MRSHSTVWRSGLRNWLRRVFGFAIAHEALTEGFSRRLARGVTHFRLILFAEA
jgi:hypothetical protein